MSFDKSDPEYIEMLLDKNNVAVHRAIVAIYNKQTQDEKTSENTLHSNGAGFSGADARYGTYLATWILSGKNLTGSHLERARKMAKKYIRQLSEIVKAKQ